MNVFFHFQVKQIFVRNHNERFIFTIFVEQDLRGSNNKVNLSGALGIDTSAMKRDKAYFENISEI